MRGFIGQIDTPGGHILICLILIAIAAGLWALHVPKSDDLMVGAMSVLFGSMRGRGGSGPEKDIPSTDPVVKSNTTTTESTVTAPVTPVPVTQKGRW